MFLAAADLGSCMFVISAGIVYDGSRYLCFRKGEAKYPYLSHRYEFPGGKVEPGETPEQALVREFSEELELSVDIDALRPVGEVQYSYPDFDVLIHAFLVPMDSCEPVLTEHESAGWFGRDELRSLDWIEADRLIVDLLEDSP